MTSPKIAAAVEWWARRARSERVVPVLTLCGDCLRACRVPLALVHEAPCAGCGNLNVCNCDSCMATLALLRAGKRGTVDGALRRDLGDFEWSPEKGFVTR